MKQEFYDAVEASPVIAAVKNTEDLKRCCQIEEIQVVFLLFGDVCSISDLTAQIKDAGKIAMVHIDLITGLSPREVAVDFIHKNTLADGIISTKPALIRRAAELSMYTVLRYFLLDSMALENIRLQQHQVRPDFIEILPGVMPQIIKRVSKSIKTPIIAGGLITDKEEVVAALNAGAMAISSTNHKVWSL